MAMRVGATLTLAIVLGGAVACTRDEAAAPSTSAAPVTSVAPTTGLTTTAAPTTTSAAAPATTLVTTTTITSAPPTTTTTTTPPVTTTAVPTTLAPTTLAPPTTAAPPTTRPASPAVALWEGPSGRHEIALTFDAGSDVGYAAAILDQLAAEGIRASFGITGEWAEANPQLVARMDDEGHVLINHTQDHPYMTQLTTEQRLAELAAADAAVSEITGRSMQPFFRPPFGDQNDAVLRDVAHVGYRWSVMWSVDSLGWKGLAATDVATRVLDAASDGGIVLMHVGSQSTDAAALRAIIDGLRADGYAFVTVADLVR